MKLKIMIFKLKIFFYKTKVVNLFLKYFLNNWNFIKVISKPSFTNWHVLQEKYFEATRPILDTLSNVYKLYGVLDASRCQMSRCRWRVVNLI